MKAERQFNIRAGARDDAPAIHGLIHELAVYEKLEHLMTSTPASIEAEVFGEKSPAETLVAEAEGKVVGFALFFHNFSTFLGRRGLYLEDLYVKPEYRHRGIGRALLVRLARVAEERGCGRFEWMVLDWNAPAIRFYESLGAQRLTEWQLCRVTGDALRQLALIDSAATSRESDGRESSTPPL